MTNFPLYDDLKRQLPSKDLSIKEKERFIQDIKKIDNKGLELIFVLIQSYKLENENENKDENKYYLPYKPLVVEKDDNKDIKDISWSLNDFPIKLRHILYKFVIVHFQSIKEDKSNNYTDNKTEKILKSSIL